MFLNYLQNKRVMADYEEMLYTRQNVTISCTIKNLNQFFRLNHAILSNARYIF